MAAWKERCKLRVAARCSEACPVDSFLQLGKPAGQRLKIPLQLSFHGVQDVRVLRITCQIVLLQGVER
jgi:hypothetical protein